MSYDERRDILSNERLRELIKRSTSVVGWWPHHKTVRGPFGRWFTVSEQLNDWKAGNLAYHADDIAFASAAMNNIEPLLDRYELLEEKLKITTEALTKSREELSRYTNYANVNYVINNVFDCIDDLIKELTGEVK